MQLKSYQIDGRSLCTGAANFSVSGLKRQDNDLVVLEGAKAAAAFKDNFEARFASGETLSLAWLSSQLLWLYAAMREIVEQNPDSGGDDNDF
jgi:phosphatidylserine/phosphatidylglycerophosphate/cardiolipin synthase-like enzyme